jgi:pyroglutamyl-peptidase
MPTAVHGRVKRALALIALAACADAPEAQESPNAGLLRDFVENGKFDAAGHVLNAKSLDAREVCGGTALRTACTFDVPSGAMTGELIVNARLRATQVPSRGAIVKLALLDDSGNTVGTKSLTVSQLRDRSAWLDVSIQSSAAISKVRVEPQPNAKIELDYIEIFPRHFGLVVAPGSGVYADTDAITFEVPAGRRLEKLSLDGVDILPRLDQLVSQGKATRTTTTFRTLISANVGDLFPARDDVAELAVRAGASAARVQLRKAAAPCKFDGDPDGKKVFITGFQPFPADGWHDNISGVAVTAMNPENLRNAQVMRLVLPVEYDRAPQEIVDVIERCNPDVVISFGQGGGAIALEQTAYNLQDTGEISGGVPDNRGIIRAAVEIEEGAAPTRATRLPLEQIHDALSFIGEFPQMSTDPGRYICNNTMFLNIGTGKRAGFIHLPYTTTFDDTVRARWAKVVETAVQAAVDAP